MKNALVREHPGSLVQRELAKIFDFCLRDCKTASMRAHKKMGVLIPSAPVCALGQLPLISKGSLLPTLYTRGALRFARKCPDTNKKR